MVRFSRYDVKILSSFVGVFNSDASLSPILAKYTFLFKVYCRLYSRSI